MSINEIGSGLCKDCFLQIERDKKYSLAKKLMQHRFHDYWDVLDEDDFYDLVNETIEEFKRHITQSNGFNTVLERESLQYDIKSILPTIKDGYSYNEAVTEKLLAYTTDKIKEAEEKGYIRGSSSIQYLTNII